MSGNFENNIFRKSGRKKWTLFRGSRGLFQRVGTEMAEDGCPDAQFNLANELLRKRCESSSEEMENAREGIYWLVKASEQGHLEATELLRKCLETGKGITDHNVSEVIECLETTRNEKLSVKAMRDLFMNFSEGEEFITSNQLKTKLQEANRAENKLPQIEAKKSQIDDWRERASCSSGNKLTEDVLVSAARTYARGQLPDIGQSLVPSERNISRSKRVSSICEMLLLPQSFNQLYSYMLLFNPRVIASLLYVSPAHLKILVFLFIYSTFRLHSLLAVAPTLIHYVSIFVMIGASCQMLNYRKRFNQFRCWSNLFLLYGGENFSAEEAEFLHCRNGISAYAYFFVSLLVNLFIQSFMPVKSFFQAEITFAAFLFTLLTLISFTFSKSRYMTSAKRIDYLGLLSFMLHVLAKYPYETDSVVGMGWRFLDLQVPTFASHVVGHGIEFCLNFRAFFYLIIPAVLVKMAARYNWRGVYSDLFPHCVTLSWWQLTLIYAEDATWYSLIRPALALVGVVFFLPLTALVSVILPVYAAFEFISNYEDLRTVAVTGALGLGIVWLFLRQLINLSPRSSYLFSVIRIIVTIIAAVFVLSQSKANLKVATESESLDVSEFTAYCNSFNPPYTDNARMEAQIACSQMLGLPVRWQGTVRTSKISKIHNPVAAVANKLPLLLSRYVNCIFGEEYPLCSSSFRVEFCKTLPNSCHLNNWNSYEFEIKVDVLTESRYTLPVALVTTTTFYNFTRKLNAGDEIWFAGSVVADENGIVNAESPRVDVSSITCISCTENELTEVSSYVQISVMHLYNFIKYLLNLLFNPLIVFR